MAKSTQRKKAGKVTRESGKRARRNYLDEQEKVVEFEPNVYTKHPPVRKPKLEYRTEVQGHYHFAMQSHTLTFGVGPAGTGKSHIAVLHGAKLLDEKKIARLIVTRPAVEAGENIGFLPGTAEEKTDPYFAPVKAMLADYFGDRHLEFLIKRGDIELAPMGFLRGVTFDDAFILLDEGQNVTEMQMKMFLSRTGENCTVVVNGDMDQKDIACRSGLEDAVERLEGMDSVAIIRFTDDDIVRSKFVRELMKRYRRT